MSSIDKIAAVYEVALEKRAMEEVYETYGVDGYLPPGYADAFFEMEKDAGLMSGVASLGKSMAQSGGKLMAQGGTKMNLARDAAGKAVGHNFEFTGKGLGQWAQHHGGRALRATGRAIESNPGTATAIAGGTAAAGLGGAAMLAGRRN